MPKAAHNRSDRTCTGSGRSEYSRVERLSLSAVVNDRPPSLRGGGNSRGLGSCATVTVGAAVSAALARIPALAWRRVIIVSPLFTGCLGCLLTYGQPRRLRKFSRSCLFHQSASTYPALEQSSKSRNRAHHITLPRGNHSGWERIVAENRDATRLVHTTNFTLTILECPKASKATLSLRRKKRP